LAREGLSDEALLAAFVAGDDAAFTALMRRHEERAFAIAVRVIKDRSEALDATQEAFVTIYRRAGSFRGDAAFTTWLYRITVNACNDTLRKKARGGVLESDPEAHPNEMWPQTSGGESTLHAPSRFCLPNTGKR
jgi:RNA polymerase sigma-70 factor (ECF subfamily)